MLRQMSSVMLSTNTSRCACASFAFFVVCIDPAIVCTWCESSAAARRRATNGHTRNRQSSRTATSRCSHLVPGSCPPCPPAAGMCSRPAPSAAGRRSGSGWPPRRARRTAPPSGAQTAARAGCPRPAAAPSAARRRCRGTPTGPRSTPSRSFLGRWGERDRKVPPLVRRKGKNEHKVMLTSKHVHVAIGLL